MKEKLKEYRKKRNFTNTNEPFGKQFKSKKKLRYVIQMHQASHLHYDFRLEWDGVLLSWAVPKGPSLNTKDKRLAVRTEDHPLEYQEFEGVIPKGEYGGGVVLIFDQGYWYPTIDVDSGLKEGVLKFVIEGERIKGAFTLIKMKDNNWLLIKEKDKYAKKSTGIGRYKRSVVTNRTLKEIDDASMISCPNVELALLNEEVPEGKEWIYEIKYDGYRMVAELNKGNVQLFSRNKQNITHKFPELKEDLEKLQSTSMILDGEVIMEDDKGRSSFSALQQSIKEKNTGNAVYMVFDILFLNGKDLRDEPLKKRKEILQKVLNKKKLSHILYSNCFKCDGEALLKKVEALDLEGIVAKNLNSKYLGKRSGNWIKIKCRKSDEFLILGYEKSTKRSIKNLILGAYENQKVVYRGKVGTGFASDSEDLLKLFKKYQTKSPAVAISKSPNIVFLKPHFIAEIDFAEYTSKGLLRQASFKGLRNDKNTSDLKKNKDMNVDYPLTSPERIIFAKKKITKRDVMAYYQKIASLMLPYIYERPMSVMRVNDSLENAFYKKHPTSKKEHGIKIFKKGGKEYFFIGEEQGVFSEVQNGTVEFHIGASSYPHLNKPNYMVFDFDPDEKLSIAQVRQGVKHLKQILNKLNLRGFLKVSGGKGYHVVVPFKEVKDWKTFSSFAFKVAKLMEDTWTDLYTTSISKKNRHNKIFIDYLRNKEGATSVAPYSLRARPNASVSMPIFWTELDKVEPDAIDMKRALERIKKNPWRDFEKVRNKQILK